jgi:hypothetical protein
MLQINNLHANVGYKSISQNLSFALSLALATLPASAHADEVDQRPVLESRAATGSVDISDEIAPAVVPYLMCLNNAVNDGIKMAGGSINIDQMPAIEADALERCTAVRKSSAVEGEKLLKAHDGKFEPTSGAAKIEGALASIEAMFTDMVAKTKQMDGAPIEKEKTDAPNN